jgi:basic membrane lipoprotein Med (substrate-binding protein (PBP1-ABC) superfamily)
MGGKPRRTAVSGKSPRARGALRGSRARRPGSGRRLPGGVLTWAVAAAVAVAGCVAGVLVATASGPRATPPVRARQYLAFTACLLTDSRGVTGSPAAQVWAGMQDASLTTHAKAEYLPVYGTTAAAAQPYLASLVQRRCGMVLAVGTAQVSAVTADALRYPQVRFVAISAVRGSRGVATVDPADGQVRASVARLISAAVQS